MTAKNRSLFAMIGLLVCASIAWGQPSSTPTSESSLAPLPSEAVADLDEIELQLSMLERELRGLERSRPDSGLHHGTAIAQRRLEKAQQLRSLRELARAIAHRASQNRRRNR
jgi:hypothetical protein